MSVIVNENVLNILGSVLILSLNLLIVKLNGHIHQKHLRVQLMSSIEVKTEIERLHQTKKLFASSVTVKNDEFIAPGNFVSVMFTYELMAYIFLAAVIAFWTWPSHAFLLATTINAFLLIRTFRIINAYWTALLARARDFAKSNSEFEIAL